MNWTKQPVETQIATLNSNVAALTPGTRSFVRPLSADQKSNWTYTAPSAGTLFFTVVGTTRTWIAFYLNSAIIGGVAIPAATPNYAVPYNIKLRAGDVFVVENLTANCYINSGTCGFYVNH